MKNELKKLKAFDSSYFVRKNHFEEDGTQSSLVLQLKVIAKTVYV